MRFRHSNLYHFGSCLRLCYLNLSNCHCSCELIKFLSSPFLHRIILDFQSDFKPLKKMVLTIVKCWFYTIITILKMMLSIFYLDTTPFDLHRIPTFLFHEMWEVLLSQVLKLHGFSQLKKSSNHSQCSVSLLILVHKNSIRWANLMNFSIAQVLQSLLFVHVKVKIMMLKLLNIRDGFVFLHKTLKLKHEWIIISLADQMSKWVHISW